MLQKSVEVLAIHCPHEHLVICSEVLVIRSEALGWLASLQLVGLPGDGKMGARLACSGELVTTIAKRWRAGLVMTKS